MFNSVMRISYKPPMNTEKFTEWLQWALGDYDEVKLETHAIGDTNSEMVYSVDGKISQSIYKFCDGGARFAITIIQLSPESEQD